jgi:hypothetical protein
MNKIKTRGHKVFSLPIIFLSALMTMGVALAVPPGSPFNPPGDPTANVPGNPAAGTDFTNILAFPQRDFVSATGYDPADRVVVRVIHDPLRYPPKAAPALNGGTTGEANTEWKSPNSDSDGDGINDVVEVNHPGGYCWAGQTPDIRPGDTVEIEVMANAAQPARVGRIDRTYVRNVKAKRPVVLQDATPGVDVNGNPFADGIVTVQGTAQEDTPGGAAGKLAIGLLESRLVSPGNLFDLNGKRTLRANNAGGVEGILNYDVPADPNDFNWTATYTGLTSDDITRATGADSRGMWLGNSIAPAVESSIYEIGSLTFPGPASPCTAPLEVLPPPPGSELIPPTDPTNLTAALKVGSQNQIDLNWTASTDNIGVTSYGVYRNGQAIFTVQNQDGSAPAPIKYSDKNIPPGTYTYHVVAFDEVGNASNPSNETDGVPTTIQLGGTFPVAINDPPLLPINIIAFPSRDFISPSGYDAGDKVSVQLLRKGPSGALQIISSSDGISPVDTSGVFFAEVNHPGGSCWEGLTPDIRVGDIVRTIALNEANVDIINGVKVSNSNPLGIRSIDQTTIAGVTAFKPVVDVPATPGNNDGVVSIHGTALGADGKPIPIDQIEQRMIATHGVGLWDFNNKRALRAASVAADGILSYDTVNNPMGVNWTATYSGLDQADVTRMADADTRIHWLGRDPLLLNEATIFENAPDTNPPGPAGPGCTAPLETADHTNPSIPGGFTMAFTGNQAKLDWTASVDDWYVAGYRVFDNNTAVANTDPSTNTFTLTNLTPGVHHIELRSFDTASPLGAGANDIEQISNGLGNLYGNLSDPADGGNGTSLDVTAPSAPNITSGTAAPGQATITWSESNDNVGVTKYTIYRDGAAVDSITGNPPSPRSFVDTGLAVGSFSYQVDASDAAGNTSAKSSAFTVDITAVPDTEAPTVPDNVSATTPNFGTTVNVTWTASTDNVGVSGYKIYRQDFTAAAPVQIGTVNGTTLSFSETPGAGTYQYSISAVDSAGNESAQSAQSTASVASATLAAGHGLVAFPARDFISATGFNNAHTYSFNVLRQTLTGIKKFTTNAMNPVDAGNTLGIVEANHPGASGTCWNVNTPDMRPGDVVQIVDNNTGVTEQTIVMNVTAERPIAINANTIVIHGIAKEADGTPIPIGQLEHRLVSSNANPFAVGRTLRAATGGIAAGADGDIKYDTTNNPDGTKWTATYTGLSATDVLRAVGGTSGTAPNLTVFTGAESRGVWLGRAPLAAADLTIFENGPGVGGGPAAPCTAPAEPNRPAASLNLTPLLFTATSFNTVPQASSPTQTVLFSNGGGADLTITNIHLAGANPGEFVRLAPVVVAGIPACPTVFPATLTTGSQCNVQLQMRPTAVGLRQAYLAFTNDAANTTDQAVPLSGAGIDTSDPRVTLNPSTGLNFGGAVNGGSFVDRTLTVTNTGTGKTLDITRASFTGTAAADFAVQSSTCYDGIGAIPVAPTGTCSITVRFSPGATGTRTATMVLAHNATLPSAATTTTVALTATGGTGPLPAFKSSVTFGSVTRGTTKNQTVTFANNATTANATTLLNFQPVKFGVTGTGYSLVSNTCTAATLAAKASCSVTVRYTAALPANVTNNGTLQAFSTNGMPLIATTPLTASTK